MTLISLSELSKKVLTNANHPKHVDPAVSTLSDTTWPWNPVTRLAGANLNRRTPPMLRPGCNAGRKPTHGRYTMAAVAERREVRDLWRIMRALIGETR
jgi:hypothetical protein